MFSCIDRRGDSVSTGRELRFFSGAAALEMFATSPVTWAYLPLRKTRCLAHIGAAFFPNVDLNQWGGGRFLAPEWIGIGGLTEPDPRWPRTHYEAGAGIATTEHGCGAGLREHYAA